MFSDDRSRSEASDLSSRFQESFIVMAAQRGWSIDNTSDLSLILRLPGTYNHKQDDTFLVKVLSYDGSNRYSQNEISETVRMFIIDGMRDAGGHQQDIVQG